MGGSKGGHERRPEHCWSWGQLSVQQHIGTQLTTHLLQTPVTSNHQYASIPSQLVPVLVPRPSEGGVAREFGPCSELMMSDKLESEVEFALVLGVGKWRA